MCKLSLGCSFLSLLIKGRHVAGDVICGSTDMSDSTEREHFVHGGNIVLNRLLDRWWDRGGLVQNTQESAYVRKDFLQDEGTWVPPLLGCLPDIKSFRIQYLRAKEQNNTSGQERTKFIYFQHLAKFMSTRPIAQSELVVNAGAEYVNVD